MGCPRHAGVATTESPIKARAVPQVRVAAAPRCEMFGFLAVFAAALSGFAGIGVWALAACAIALASLSYAEHYSLYRRGQELGQFEALRSTALRSFGNALFAAGGAYACGYLLRLL